MEEGTKKQSQGDECSFVCCLNRIYDATAKKKHAVDFLHFQGMKSFVEFAENRVARKSGKDGFRITKVTVVCNIHFQVDDILRVPGGSW